MGHYLRSDTRINIVKNIISPFQLQLNDVDEMCKKENYIHWDDCYADDTEHLVGTVFIVLQNYINSSISDLFPDLKKLFTKYALDKKIGNTQTSRIELIIAIANYYKHRDSPTTLHENTSKIFDNLNINFKYVYDAEGDKYFHEIGSNSPVFTGFSVLSELWNFDDLINIVSEWRENMWLNKEELIKAKIVE